MQISVPNGPQPTQNPPLVQWNPCKYYSMEQRPSKPEPQVTRAVKMDEKLHFKYDLYSNSKDINTVRGEKLLPQEGASSKILLMHVSSKQ